MLLQFVPKVLLAAHNNEQRRDVVECIPERDRNIWRALNIDKYNATIAGGAALRWHRGLTVESHDIDIWFKNVDDYNNMMWDLSRSNHTTGSHSTVNAWSVKYVEPTALTVYKIQLIKHYHSDVQTLLNSFDISVAQVAVDSSGWHFGEHTLADIDAQHLRVLSVHKTIWRRLFKYWTYGYNPSDDTLRQLIGNTDIQTNYSQESPEDY